MEKLLASVIIIARNEEDSIGACIDSLLKQTLPRESYEIIVVDGESVDRTREIAEEMGARVVIERKHTFGHARNVGVSSAKGEYVCFISADCVADSRWLESLLSEFEEKEVCGVVGRQLPMKSRGIFSKVRELGFLAKAKQQRRVMRLGQDFSTVNCAYRRFVVEAVGGFNEELVACEDQEIAHRILKALGCQIVYQPNAVVFHEVENGLRAIARKELRQGLGLGYCDSLYGAWRAKRLLSNLFIAYLLMISLSLLLWALLRVEAAITLVYAFLSAALIVDLAHFLRAMIRTKNPLVWLASLVYYPVVTASHLIGFFLGRHFPKLAFVKS